MIVHRSFFQLKLTQVAVCGYIVNSCPQVEVVNHLFGQIVLRMVVEMVYKEEDVDRIFNILIDQDIMIFYIDDSELQRSSYVCQDDQPF